jgi:hypothetical protein
MIKGIMTLPEGAFPFGQLKIRVVGNGFPIFLTKFKCLVFVSNEWEKFVPHENLMK